MEVGSNQTRNYQFVVPLFIKLLISHQNAIPISPAVDLAPRACITLKEVRHFPPRRVARLTYSTVPYVSRTGASFYSNRTWQIDGSVPIIAIVLVVMQRE